MSWVLRLIVAVVIVRFLLGDLLTGIGRLCIELADSWERASAFLRFVGVGFFSLLFLSWAFHWIAGLVLWSLSIAVAWALENWRNKRLQE